MFQGKAKTVSEYLDALPPERRAVVNKVRSLVKKHLPKGYKEEIGWGVITYSIPLKILPDTYNGQPLCYVAVAALKNDYSLYLMNVYGDPKKKKWMADEFKKRGEETRHGRVLPSLQVARRSSARCRRRRDRQHADGEVH